MDYLKRETGLILALDILDEQKAFELLDKTQEYIDAVKINWPIVMSCGLGIAQKIKEKYNLSILADFKVADVPVTNHKIIKLAIDSEIDAIMIHGFIGPDAISSCNDVANDEIGIIIVTELTNPGGKVFTQYFSEDFARLAVDLGCYGIQAPGNRPERIKRLREIIGNDLIIVACGCGTEGGNVFDKAIKSGADFVIAGRSIYKSENPSKTAQEIVNKILDIN